MRVHDGSGVEVAVDGEVKRQLRRRRERGVDEPALEIDDDDLVGDEP